MKPEGDINNINFYCPIFTALNVFNSPFSKEADISIGLQQISQSSTYLWFLIEGSISIEISSQQ